LASPPQHASAVALSFLPVIANLITIQLEELLRGLKLAPEALTGTAQATYQGVLVLGNGFIFTAFLWAALLIFMIDRRLFQAAMMAGLAAVATLCGMIHSPFPGGALFFPWQMPSSIPLTIASAYGLLALLLFLLAYCSPTARNQWESGNVTSESGSG
jgi:AGZA family xanthine/uracil permease-like MFS transporter